jgi:hypothetical protein
MPIPRLPQNDREITYQVGWKKGVIQPKPNSETVDIDPNEAHKEAPKEAPKQAPLEGIERYIWYKAPLLPASLDMFIVCALPIISIAAIAMLVYFINQF